MSSPTCYAPTETKLSSVDQKYRYEIGIDDHRDVYDIVIRDNGNIIAVCSSGEGPVTHLVKAGNCHDQLIEMLEHILERGLIYWEPQTVRGAVAKAEMIEKARAILAKGKVK